MSNPRPSELPVSAFPFPWRAAAFRLWRGEVWSLYLHGAVGTGKTCFAEAIMRRWREEKWIGYLVPPDLLQKQVFDFDTWKMDWREIYGTTPMLILDDIGAHREGWLGEQVALVLGRRHREGLRTVLTSNLDLAGLAEAVDPRVASRLQEGEIINTGTKDLRKGQAKCLTTRE